MYKPGGKIAVTGGKRSLLGEWTGGRKGVFAQNPAMTPKYHTNNNEVSLGYMARMFIPFEDPALGEAFVNSFGEDDATKILATALTSAGYGYLDFLLQRADEPQQEKFQVVDVLSDNYVSYFYGRQPPMFQYSGVLLNTVQDDWRMAFHLMYNKLLRGTKMARHKTVVTLAYDDIFVTGVLVNMQQSLSADMEIAVPFSFTMLVKQIDLHTRYWGTNGYNPTKAEVVGLQLPTWIGGGNVATVTTGAKSTGLTVSGARFTVTAPTAKATEDPKALQAHSDLPAPQVVPLAAWGMFAVTTPVMMEMWKNWTFLVQKDDVAGGT